MTDIASLGVVVRPDGIQQTKQQLDQLTASGDRAERSTQKLNQTARKTSGSFSSQKIREQRKELSQLLGQIDPTVAALGRLDQAESKLRKFRSQGLVDTETYNDYLRKLGQQRTALAGVSAVQGKAAISAKQLAFATRGLPAQFTDIAVSLQAGQRPLQVFLQQGGQIKDTFGGVGPALRAMGGYTLGLINPVTLLAGAAAGLFLAFKAGQDDTYDINKALILTGNYAGTTSTKIEALVEQFASLEGVTSGGAREALLRTAQAGRFAGEQFTQVAEIAARLESSAGQSIDTTVSKFEELARRPLETLLKLNEAENFLTQAQYDRIRSLKEEGRTQDAASEAVRIYANRLGDVADAAEAARPHLSRMWQEAKEGASAAWEEAKNFTEFLAAAGERQRNDPWWQRFAIGTNAFNTIRALYSAEPTLPAAVSGVPGAVESTTLRAQEEARQKALEERKRAEAEWESQIVSNLTKRERLEREILEIRTTGAKLGKTEAEIQTQIAKAQARYADSISKRNPQQKRSAADGIIAQLQRQIALNEEELQSQERLTASDRVLVQVQLELERIGNNRTDAEARLIESLKERTRVSGNALEAMKAEALAKSELTRLTSQLAAEEAQLRDSQQADLLQAGLGQREAQRLLTKFNLEREFQARLAQLRENARGLDDQAILEQEAALRASYERRLDDAEGYFRESQRQMQDWTNGAKSALANYVESAQDVAGQTQEIFSRAFKGLEDSLVNFITTGKGGFKDLLKSIEADITRFVVRQQLSKFLEYLGGLFSGGGSSSQGGLGNALGSVIGSVYGGQRAIGGPVSAGKVYQFGEKGSEILTMHGGGKQYLLPSANGKVTPAQGGGQQFTQYVNVMVDGTPDRRTVHQIARESGSEVRRALARSG